MSMQWLSSVTTVLTLLVVIAGFVISLVVYLRQGRARVALLGTLGFGLMFLLSCCSVGWLFADQPMLHRFPWRSRSNYYVLRSIALFVLGLANLGGLALLISAVWVGSQKD
jgi:hypothetical protein